MRSGVLKKNESNSRSAPNSHAARNMSANSKRLTCTDVPFSGENHGAGGRGGRAGATCGPAAMVAWSGVSTEVIDLCRQFAPEGVVQPPELRQVVNVEDV